jgi:nucleotide-binding universal stress UspA family protein
VIAAHAVPYEPLAGLAAVPPLIELDVEWRDALQAMRTYQENHCFTGLRHQFVMEHGLPREVIADLAARHAADLVVVGTHGRQGFHKLFAGSFAEEIFRTVTCPVLTIGPGVKSAPFGEWKPRRILLATEFAEGSIHALPCAITLAEVNDAKLLIMHAIPLVPWEQQVELEASYRARLQKLADEIPHRCPIDFRVEFDLVAPAILAAAEESEADLIVMGVHHARLPRVDAHVPGTTASDVIGNAHCPVLTVCG